MKRGARAAFKFARLHALLLPALALPVLAGLSTLSGCAHGARFVASTAEYSQYRRARVATQFEPRLRESWRYLRAYPNGQWRSEVSSWFSAAEERTRVAAWNDLARLTRYIKVLPDGPYAGSVRSRIRALEERARSASIEEVSLLRRQRERQLRLDQAETSRREFRRELVELVSRLSQFKTFGQPLTGTELQRWLMQGESPAECSTTLCTKELVFSFDVPVQGQLQARPVVLNLRVEQNGQGVQRLVLQGFSLLERIHESVAMQVVPMGDAQARAEAVGTAVLLLGTALHAELPEAECGREALSPVVLARGCQGRGAHVSVAEDLTQPDTLEFAPQR